MIQIASTCLLSLLLVLPAAVAAQNALSTSPCPTASSERKQGTISGQVIIDGIGPMTGGQILFYDAATGPPPSKHKYTRVPDIIRTIGENGRFRETVPAGEYYLGAIMRHSDQRSGIPKKSGHRILSSDKQGALLVYRVGADAAIDAGIISGKTTTRRLAVTGITAIEGIITDREGNPQENLLVLAFTGTEMNRRPLFISERSEHDGHYVLRLSAGTYFLRVKKDFVQGPPLPGQPVSSYGNQEPLSITIRDGEIKAGVDIKVTKFPGRGPSGRGQAAPGAPGSGKTPPFQ